MASVKELNHYFLLTDFWNLVSDCCVVWMLQKIFWNGKNTDLCKLAAVGGV
jgi:hypothetical protein